MFKAITDNTVQFSKPIVQFSKFLIVLLKSPCAARRLNFKDTFFGGRRC